MERPKNPVKRFPGRISKPNPALRKAPVAQKLGSIGSQLPSDWKNEGHMEADDKSR